MAETTDDNAAPANLDPMTADLAAQGFAIADGFPANHRLRAEALATAGKDADPAGHISPELIAETRDRMAAEARDAERADQDAAVTAKAGKAELERIAQAEGVDLSAATNNEQRADAINAARDSKEG